jgi:hypothetical protein
MPGRRLRVPDDLVSLLFLQSFAAGETLELTNGSRLGGVRALSVLARLLEIFDHVIGELCLEGLGERPVEFEPSAM